jgi:hypothetical protein
VTEKEHQHNLKQIAKAIKASNAFFPNCHKGRPTRKSGSATSKRSFEAGDIPTQAKLCHVTLSHPARPGAAGSRCKA